MRFPRVPHANRRIHAGWYLRHPSLVICAWSDDGVENDLVHPDGSADCSMESNSSSMTVVGHTFTDLPFADTQFSIQKQVECRKPASTVHNSAPFKTVYASKGVLKRRLSGNRRMRYSSPHLHATSSRTKAQRKLRFANAPLVGTSTSNVRKFSKPRVVQGVPVPGKLSSSTTSTGDGDPHFGSNLLSGRKSQIPHAEPPVTTEEPTPLREFMATIPENLQRSPDFQNLLTRAANKAMRRQLDLR